MIYIALLRGINVGGNNIIKMADLRVCLTQAGFANVQTYIQSGNVVFEYKKSPIADVEKKIEKALKKAFDYDGFVVVLGANILEKIIAEAPKQFGEKTDDFKYDVIFLKAPLAAKKLYDVIPVRDGIDQKFCGKHAVYFARPTAELSKSQLSKIVSLPEYQHVTVRNWNTTNKLQELANT